MAARCYLPRSSQIPQGPRSRPALWDGIFFFVMTPELIDIQRSGMKALSQAMKTTLCAAIVGSGPVAKEYGTWQSLLDSIFYSISLNQTPEQKVASAQGERTLPEWADFLFGLSADIYTDSLHRIFSRGEVIPKVYNSIIRAKFRSITTTNFDDQLMEAVEMCGLTDHLGQMVWPALLPEMKGMIVHLHGRIKVRADVGRIVLRKSQFEKAYEPEEILPDILRSAFRTYHMCFIGYSFSEEEIQNIFKSAKESFRRNFDDPGSQRSAFAFIQERDWMSSVSASRIIDDVTRMYERFSSFGITPIPFAPADDQFSGLRKLIDELPVEHLITQKRTPPWNPQNEKPLGPSI